MTITVCPNCGLNLVALHALELGDLKIEYDGAIIAWRGRAVPMSPVERLMILSLARADGAPVRRTALADAMGYEGENPENIVAVHLARIQKRFRELDPAFDHIENVRLRGIRWRQ